MVAKGFQATEYRAFKAPLCISNWDFNLIAFL